MTAAEPDQLGRHPVALEDRVVLHRLLEAEDRVRAALEEQRGHADLLHQRSRGARAEERHRLLGELAGRRALDQRLVDLRVEVPGLRAGGADQPGEDGALAGGGENRSPSLLDDLLLVESGEQRVPGDRRCDRVHPAVDSRRDELDSAAIAGAAHAQPRVVRAVELGLGLLGHVVDQRLNVAPLEVLRVNLHLPARAAEAAGVPGEHVVPGAPDRPHARLAEDGVGARVLVGLPRHAIAMAREHCGGALARRQPLGREEVGDDRGAVERLDDGVARHGGSGRRQPQRARREGDRECPPRTHRGRDAIHAGRRPVSPPSLQADARAARGGDHGPSPERRRQPARAWSRRWRPGMVTMKTFDPPLDAIAGATVEGVRRRGKMFVVELGELALLIHLMSAGRLQLWDARASLRDRASRLLVRLEDGRELRLREFGTQQRAFAKLLPAAEVEEDEAVASSAPTRSPLPEGFAELARPAPPPPPAPARPAHDRGHRPLLGGRDPLDRPAVPVQEGRGARSRGGGAAGRGRSDDGCPGALDHYEEVIGEKVPDKLPMPLEVHRRTRRALPPLRDAHRGDPFQGLRHVLLPRGADRRPGAEGPQAVEAAEVARCNRERRPPTSSWRTRTATP